MPPAQAYIDFFAAHPEFKDEPTFEYRCTSCGNNVDEDHDYCAPCDQRGGDWVMVDVDGEEIEMN
jgi:rRNA maturation endonuclease Nob1